MKKKNKKIKSKPSIQPLDSSLLGSGVPNYVLDPKRFKGDAGSIKTTIIKTQPEGMLTSFPPLTTPEEEKALQQFTLNYPELVNIQAAKFKDSNEPWIQTYTGKKFYPLNPRPEDICIEDIAHTLSMLCRFTGHSKQFYSVGQHSVLVSQYCYEKYALKALLHDSAEAYIADISSPLKRTSVFDEYRKIEEKIQNCIYRKFNIPLNEGDEYIKKTDLKALATEVRDLMAPVHPDFKLDEAPFEQTIKPLSPKAAKYLFLARFYELTEGNNG